jgi:hypothetical protein
VTVAAVNEDGFMLHVSDEYAARAVARGEAVWNSDGHLQVVPQPIRSLSPEEKRRAVLARERAKR